MKQYKPPKYKKNKFLKNYYQNGSGLDMSQQEVVYDDEHYDYPHVVASMNGKRRLKKNAMVSYSFSDGMEEMRRRVAEEQQEQHTPLFTRRTSKPFNKFKSAFAFTNRVKRLSDKAYSARRHSENRSLDIAPNSSAVQNLSEAPAFQQMEMERRAYLHLQQQQPELSSFDFMAPSVEVKSRGTQTMEDAIIARLQQENQQMRKYIEKLEFEKDEQKKTLRIIEELFSEPQAVRRELSKWKEKEFEGLEREDVVKDTKQPASNTMLPPKYKSRGAKRAVKAPPPQTDSLAVTQDARYHASTSPRRSLDLTSEDATRTENLVVTSNAKRKPRAVPARRYKVSASDAMSEDSADNAGRDTDSVLANMSTRGIASVMSQNKDFRYNHDNDDEYNDDLASQEPSLGSPSETKGSSTRVVLNVPSVGPSVSQIHYYTKSSVAANRPESSSFPLPFTQHHSVHSRSGSTAPHDNESTATGPTTVTAAIAVDASSTAGMGDGASVLGSQAGRRSATRSLRLSKRATLSLPDINDFRFEEDFM